MIPSTFYTILVGMLMLSISGTMDKPEIIPLDTDGFEDLIKIEQVERTSHDILMNRVVKYPTIDRSIPTVNRMLIKFMKEPHNRKEI